MDATPSCRFCLSSEAEIDNPMLTPCNCSGSVAHVHLKCIHRWRALSAYPERANTCQICLAQFQLPSRWLQEPIPDLSGSSLWYFLILRPYWITLFTYNLHLAFVTLLSLSQHYKLDYDLIHTLFVSDDGLMYFLSLLCITGIYTRFYWKHLVSQVRNKYIYGCYWVCSNGRPMQYFLQLGISGFCVQFIVYPEYPIMPFGVLYLYVLSQFYDTHVAILRKMNADAELFVGNVAATGRYN
jgi:hypothetical protein